MIDHVDEKVAAAIAAQLARELVKLMPTLLDEAIKQIPDLADVLADRLLAQLPFPFKKSR